MSALVFLETSTNLTSGSSRNGATHDTGVSPGPYTRFRAFAAADVASAANGLTIQQSDDGTTWYVTNSVTVPAGFTTGMYLESMIAKRYCRAQYTNSTPTGQSFFNFSTALVT